MKYFLRILLLSVIGILGLAASSFYRDAKVPPALEDGDLIFQTSASNQAKAILFATMSPYTHMGIVRIKQDGVVVVEAVQPLRETPLQEWIARGVMGRYSVFRYPGLTPDRKKAILQKARSLHGRSYDIFFSFENNTIYCSELPYLAYKAAGIAIGEVQEVSDLNFDNPLVRKLIESRWQRHPACGFRNEDFDACYKRILRQKLVTPESISGDKQLKRIYSNYPL